MHGKPAFPIIEIRSELELDKKLKRACPKQSFLLFFNLTKARIIGIVS